MKEDINKIANLKGTNLAGIDIIDANLVVRSDVVVPPEVVIHAANQGIPIKVFGGVN